MTGWFVVVGDAVIVVLTGVVVFVGATFEVFVGTLDEALRLSSPSSSSASFSSSKPSAPKSRVSVRFRVPFAEVFEFATGDCSADVLCVES